ncbi:zinc finger BED domain-containing protein RICESLEEPER 2-like protein [Tanacetum coccineum]
MGGYFGQFSPMGGLWVKIYTHREFVKGQWKAICKYCKKALSGEHGTKHLHNHFDICPQRTTRDIKQTMLATKVSLDGKAGLTKHMFDQGEARKELATMIILHEYPLSMVEHVGFRRFTETIQPLFKPVSRNTIKKVIMDMYDFEKTKSMSLLEASKSRIAVTTDMWTSGNQKKGFMVVTAHFIDESWVLQNRIIRFAYVPHPHTAKELANELVDTIVEWNIDRKLSTVTVDNCSTNDSMLQKIKEKLSWSSLRWKVMAAPTIHVPAEENLSDPIDIRVDIIHPEPVATVAFPSAVVEEPTALRFRVDIAEAENASLRVWIKTTKEIEKITRNRESARYEIRYHPRKENVITNTLSRKERIRPLGFKP